MQDQNERPKKILFVTFGPNNLTRTQKAFGCLGALFCSLAVLIALVFIISPSLYTLTYPILFAIWLVCVFLGGMILIPLLTILGVQEMRREDNGDE